METIRQTSTGDAHLDRTGRIRQIIDEVWARRQAGDSVTDEGIIAGHCDLMPELGAALAKLAREADRPPPASPVGGSTLSESQLDNLLTACEQLPSDIFAGYELVHELHRGGQGTVYLAVQKSTHRRVAIKLLRGGPSVNPREQARFEREVHLLAQLRHPNIVTIHDSGTSPVGFYYVMDYIPGETLEGVLKKASDEATRRVGQAPRRGDEGTGSRSSRSRGLSATGASIRDTLALFAKICGAVGAAHMRGVVHRDLKPANIRIDTNGEPHVLDFGLAKSILGETTRDASPQVMTETGQFVGSVPWAAPEQAEANPAKIDTRTDVYSLGVILYQMLTGQFPYEVRGNLRDVLDNILHAEPARPSTIRRWIDSEVETIALKCLAKERERRYQNAADVYEDITRYLAGEAIAARRDSIGYVLRKTFRRRRAGIIISAAIALTVAATVYYRVRASALEAEIHAQRLAESAFHKSLESEREGTFKALETLGVTLLDLDESTLTPEIITKAVDAFRDAALARPSLASAHCNFANALFQAERYDECIAAADRAIGLDPSFVTPREIRGYASYRQALALLHRRDFQQGLHLLNQSLFDLGHALRHYTGRPEQAESAARLSDVMLAGHLDRARVNRLLRRYPEALEDIAMVCVERPADPIALEARGLTYWFLGRIDDAVSDFEKSIGAHVARIAETLSAVPNDEAMDAQDAIRSMYLWIWEIESSRSRDSDAARRALASAQRFCDTEWHRTLIQHCLGVLDAQSLMNAASEHDQEIEGWFYAGTRAFIIGQTSEALRWYMRFAESPDSIGYSEYDIAMWHLAANQ